MAAALGIQGNVSGSNAAFKVSLRHFPKVGMVLILDLGQGEAYGCTQREYHGSKGLDFSVPPILTTCLYCFQLLQMQSEPH